MKTLLNYQVGRVWVHVDHAAQTAVTVFPDRAQANAAPGWGIAEQAHAERLGYADCWHRCWTHELVHAWLADRRGLPFSPAIRAVADGIARDLAAEINHEEAAVEAVEQIRFLVPDLMFFLASGELVSVA